MYRALALDLDGTLTDSQKKITQKTKQTLFKAMDRGVKLILASGRPVIGITALARELELYDRGGFIMAFNGGEIIDCAKNSAVSRKTVPMQCIPEICAAARKIGCVPLTYTKTEIVAEDDRDEYVLKEKFCVNAPVKRVDDLSAFVDYETPKFLIVGPHERLVVAEKSLKEAFPELLNIFYSESYFLEVCPTGVSKSDGLAELCRYMGIERAELMACGDGMNDIPMLDYAGFSVAMANSCAQVLRRADYVTLSNDEDGVAAAVERFILGGKLEKIKKSIDKS